MHRTRTLLAAVVLVVAMVGVPLGAVAIANAVRPVIAAQPAAATVSAAEVSAMPRGPATVQPLAAQFEKLPIVSSGPDGATTPFLDAYRAVAVDDGAAAASLIDLAFAELHVAP